MPWGCACVSTVWQMRVNIVLPTRWRIKYSVKNETIERYRQPICDLSMPSSELVSVVIPAYNYARYLPAAIESVLAQTYQPIELIVVDDGSTDDTPNVVSPYADRIRYIRQANSGVCVTRNTGIRASQGKFVAFLDADDIWMPEKIQKQMEAQILHPDAGCIGCGVELVDGDLQASRQVWHDDLLGSPEQRLNDVFLRREWVGGSCSGAFVSRSVLDQIGLFDASLTAAEDWDMWLRIVQFHPVYNLREPLVRIRRHFTGSFRNADKMERNQLAVYRNQLQRTPDVFRPSIKRQAMAMILIDSARERMFARKFWYAALRLAQAISSWPFRGDAWHLLAVCLVRGTIRKTSPMKTA